MYNPNTYVYYRISQSKQVTHVSQPQKYKRKGGAVNSPDRVRIENKDNTRKLVT